MAEFLKESKLVSAIEELIDKVDEYLWLISPYIQLHDRIKDRLRLKKQNHGLEITVVFGKNEMDATKSLSKVDFEFLKEFPNIIIGYEKRLHAKFYASEDFSIITSMNLHQFSQNNNIEAGIKLKSRKWFSTSSEGEADAEAYNHFLDVIENCQPIFKNEPKYKTRLLGFRETYTHSEVKVDDSENFFKRKDDFIGEKYSQRKKQFVAHTTNQGFCIRTGKPIPFNPERPLCNEAYQIWAKHKNKDFAEKYCHRTGKLSYGQTSMRNPIME